MKKLLTLLIATLLTVLCSVTFTACFENPSGDNDNEEKQSITGTYKLHSFIQKDKIYNIGDEFSGTILTEDTYTFWVREDKTFIVTIKQNDKTENQKGTYSEWHNHYIFDLNNEKIAAELEDNYLYFIEPSMTMKFRDPNKANKGEIDHSAAEAKFIGEYEMFSLKNTDKTTGEVTIYNLGDKLSDEVTLTKDFWSMNIKEDKTFSIVMTQEEKVTQDGNWLVFNKGYVLTRDSWYSGSYTAICSFEENNLILYVIENSSIVPYLQEITLTKNI